MPMFAANYTTSSTRDAADGLLAVTTFFSSSDSAVSSSRDLYGTVHAVRATPSAVFSQTLVVTSTY